MLTVFRERKKGLRPPLTNYSLAPAGGPKEQIPRTVYKIKITECNRECKFCQGIILEFFYSLRAPGCFTYPDTLCHKGEPGTGRVSSMIDSLREVGFEPTTERVNEIINNLRAPGFEPGTGRV